VVPISPTTTLWTEANELTTPPYVDIPSGNLATPRSGPIIAVPCGTAGPPTGSSRPPPAPLSWFRAPGTPPEINTSAPAGQQGHQVLVRGCRKETDHLHDAKLRKQPFRR